MDNKLFSPQEEDISLVDKQNRGILSEGRNYQMGFAFCKKEGKGKYATVQPISPCKDYLNDTVYAELTGKPCAAYGYSCKKENIYDEKEGYAYVVIKLLGSKYGDGSYPNMDADKKNLKENYKTLEKFINYFEEQKGLDKRSQITEVDDDRYFIKVPLFWCQATYLISLYTLLLRTGQFWKGEGTPQEYIDNFGKEFPPDSYMITAAKPKLAKILTQKVKPQDLSEFRGGSDVHNHGIVAANILNI
jgi:hypothetical protein